MGLENSSVPVEQIVVAATIRSETPLIKKGRPRRPPEEILAFDLLVEPLLSEGCLLKKQIAYKLGVPTYFISDSARRIETIEAKKNEELEKISLRIKESGMKFIYVSSKTSPLHLCTQITYLYCNASLTEKKMAKELNVPFEKVTYYIGRLKFYNIIPDSRKQITSQDKIQRLNRMVKLYIRNGFSSADIAERLDITMNSVCHIVRGLIYRGELPKGTKLSRRNSRKYGNL